MQDPNGTYNDTESMFKEKSHKKNFSRWLEISILLLERAFSSLTYMVNNI